MLLSRFAINQIARATHAVQMSALALDREWRGHVEQTKKHEEAIQAALPVTTTQLALIGTEVGWRASQAHHPVF